MLRILDQFREMLLDGELRVGGGPRRHLHELGVGRGDRDRCRSVADRGGALGEDPFQVLIALGALGQGGSGLRHSRDVLVGSGLQLLFVGQSAAAAIAFNQHDFGAGISGVVHRRTLIYANRCKYTSHVWALL